MKLNNVLLITLVGLLSFGFLLVYFVSTNSSPKTEPIYLADDLTLRLGLGKTRFEINEPITLTITIHNTSGKRDPVLVQSRFAIGYYEYELDDWDVGLVVTYNTKSELPNYSYPIYVDVLPENFIYLPRGKFFGVERDLRSLFDVRREGIYKFVAYYRNKKYVSSPTGEVVWQGEIHSNEIQLEVVADSD